jgi:hypothetical protein
VTRERVRVPRETARVPRETARSAAKDLWEAARGRSVMGRAQDSVRGLGSAWGPVTGQARGPVTGQARGAGLDDPWAARGSGRVPESAREKDWVPVTGMRGWSRPAEPVTAMDRARGSGKERQSVPGPKRAPATDARR